MNEHMLIDICDLSESNTMICSPPRLDRTCEPEAVVDLRAVPGVGAEIVLTVDGELRRRRLFRAH